MAILKVAKLGHPILRQVAAPVAAEDIDSPAIQAFISDMIETMREYGGVGLAAPQVHRSVRIVLLEVHNSARYPDAPDIPLTALINPAITPLTDAMEEDWEGCLSVIDFRGKVPRYTKIGFTALDREGRAVEWEAGGFFARVLQHECDHLNGHVFLDRMRDLSTLTYLEEYQKYWLPGIRSEEDAADGSAE